METLASIGWWVGVILWHMVLFGIIVEGGNTGTSLDDGSYTLITFIFYGLMVWGAWSLF